MSFMNFIGFRDQAPTQEQSKTSAIVKNRREVRSLFPKMLWPESGARIITNTCLLVAEMYN